MSQKRTGAECQKLQLKDFLVQSDSERRRIKITACGR